MSSRCSTWFTPGNVAVITGSSSGLGRSMARHCAKAGMKVYMADIDEKELTAAAAEVGGLAVGGAADVVAVPTDVSDPAALAKLKEKAFEAKGAVHFLMNNAGIARRAGPLGALGDWEKTIAVNAWGPIHGCQAFVPAMQAQGQPGLIVNTGSKQGITCPPGDLAYNCSKSFLKTYAEGLEHELRSAPNNKLTTALFVPGFVNTSIALKSSRDKAAAEGKEFDESTAMFSEAKPNAGGTLPHETIDFMLSELEKGRFYLICPDPGIERSLDNMRMTWTMQDITQDRAPLSRWHPDYKEKFEAYIKEGTKA